MNSMTTFAGPVLTEWYVTPVFALLAFGPVSLLTATLFTLLLFVFRRIKHKPLNQKYLIIVFIIAFILSMASIITVFSYRYNREQYVQAEQAYKKYCDPSGMKTSIINEKFSAFYDHNVYPSTFRTSAISVLSREYTAYENLEICPNATVTRNGKVIKFEELHTGDDLAIEGYDYIKFNKNTIDGPLRFYVTAVVVSSK